MNPQWKVTGAALLVLLLLGPRLQAETPVTGAQALERLKAGNERFVADKTSPKNIGKEKRQELAKGQKPFAVILTCADSRVSPELIFDEGLGDLFVLRVAGNVADVAMLGSIEFAVESLRSPLIVVMGHESCGAVKAAIDGGPLQGNLATLIKMVEPGKDLPEDPKAALNAGIKGNVKHQVALLTQRSTILKEMAESDRIKIVPAIYSLTTGKVEWLDAKAVVAATKTKAEKPAPRASGASDNSPATSIHVRVPAADARVWIDDRETTSRGLARTFEPPALAAGQSYNYRIRVTWVDGQRSITREKTVSFKPGDKVEVEIKE